MELNAVWGDTLRSISELGDKVDPPPLSYDFTMDDSGVADHQDEGDDEVVAEDGVPDHAVMNQAGPGHAVMNQAGPGHAVMTEEGAGSDKENIPPSPQPSPIMRIPISREARRQMMPGASYVRMERL